MSIWFRRKSAAWLVSCILLSGSFFTGCTVDKGYQKEEPASQQNTQQISTSPQAQDMAGLGPNQSFSPEQIRATLADKPPEERTTIVLRFLSFTLLFYYSVYGDYPTTEEGLEILLNPPPAPNGKTYDSMAQQVLMEDAWGQAIQYERTNFGYDLPGFRLWSLGPDGVVSNDDLVPDVEDVVIEVSQTISAGGLEPAPESELSDAIQSPEPDPAPVPEIASDRVETLTMSLDNSGSVAPATN